MEHTILAVEDEQGIREAIGIYMKNQGYNVILAANGKEGLEKIETNDIHLAIVDIMMPVMDGIAATKAIRAMDRADAKTIPIIAMTANAFSEDIRHSLTAGMNAHISKPVEMEVLKKTIKSIKINGGAQIPISKLCRQDMEMRFLR